MTNEKWQEIVEYVTNRLKTESQFDIDKERLFEQFGLSRPDSMEFMTRRDDPGPKYFEMKTIEYQSRPVLVFSRLERPS